MQMDLCLNLELSMGNYLGFFLAEAWSLLELGLSLDPAIKANTAITQCCNFSIDSSALKTDRDM